MTAETTIELMLDLQQSQKPLIWLDYSKLNHTLQLTVFIIFTACERLVWGLLDVTDGRRFSPLPSACTWQTLQVGLRYPPLFSESVLVTWTVWLPRITFLLGKIPCVLLVNMNQAMFGIYQDSNRKLTIKIYACIRVYVNAWVNQGGMIQGRVLWQWL